MADMICHKVYELLMSILNVFKAQYVMEFDMMIQTTQGLDWMNNWYIWYTGYLNQSNYI